MNSLSPEKILNLSHLCCPRCRGTLIIPDSEKSNELRCAGCANSFPVVNGIPCLLPENAKGAEETQRFWGALYKDAYQEHSTQLGREKFLSLLDDLLEMFFHRQHLAAIEMPIDNLRGKRVLEVGCGAGAHSALFSRLGAKVYALDLTVERVLGTAAKLDMLNDDGSDLALQGDAGALPFPDGFFDIVYSNGVLHHTQYIDRAVAEIHRVLKPNGQAIIMLYAKNSFLYRCVLFPVKGILMGGVFRNKDWLGRATEWMSTNKQRVYNPKTEVFSSREIRTLFKEFRSVKIRKNSFVFDQVPLIGRRIGKLAGKKTGYNNSGILVYGFPWRNETSFEIWLGQFLGFGLNILATK